MYLSVTVLSSAYSKLLDYGRLFNANWQEQKVPHLDILVDQYDVLAAAHDVVWQHNWGLSSLAII